MKRMSTVTLVAAGLTAVAGGCLAIETLTDVRESPGEMRSRSGRLPDRRRAIEVDLEGTVLQLKVRSEATCYDESYRTVRRTELETREIAGSSWPWYVLEWGCGAACTIGGVVALALAPGLSAETGDASTGESVTLSDQDLAYIGGAGGVGVGIGLLIAAIVETVRAGDAERALPDGEETHGRTTRPCDARPTAGVPVEGTVGDRRYSLGVTGPTGAISADLRQVLDARHIARLEPPVRLDLHVAGQDVGTMDLAPYVSTTDAEAWSAAQAAGVPQTLRQYLAEHPYGLHRAEAERQIDELEWAEALAQGTAEAFESYLASLPQGLHAAEAERQVDDLEWAEALAQGTAEAFESYLASLPQGLHAAEAERQVDDLLWADVSAADAAEDYERYLVALPGGMHASATRVRIVQLLIEAKTLAEAEERIGRYAEEDPDFSADAERLQQQIDDLRARAARRIDRAVAEARRIASRCSGSGAGSGDVQTAAQAYRKLFSVRREAPQIRIEEVILEIMARCGACSPECAGVR